MAEDTIVNTYVMVCSLRVLFYLLNNFIQEEEGLVVGTLSTEYYGEVVGGKNGVTQWIYDRMVQNLPLLTQG